MAFKKNDKHVIRILKEKLESRYALLDYRVFGSKSRGDDDPDSDIDIMIELAESNQRIESEISELVFDINLANDCFISTLIFTKNELEEGPLSESPIYKAILREGVAF
jgi:uncharacterized protein